MRALLLSTMVACGGRIALTATDATVDATEDAGVDEGGFLDGALIYGTCSLDIGFTPNAMPYHEIIQTSVQATATRTANVFELVCSGKAANAYHYILRESGIALAQGPSTGPAMFVEDPDIHNPQVGVGPCTIVVETITSGASAQTVTGTIDCPSLVDDPIGFYTVRGSFTVPVR